MEATETPTKISDIILDILEDVCDTGELTYEADEILHGLDEDQILAAYGPDAYEYEVFASVESYEDGNGWDEPRLTYYYGTFTVYLRGKKVATGTIHPEDVPSFDQDVEF